ncbi:MAG: tetratricopeptide repeat protein [Sphingomonas sp.]
MSRAARPGLSALGRFVSARQAFTDALSLDPGNGRVALNLALTEIAAGDWSGARNTLETHANTIPAQRPRARLRAPPAIR